MLILNLTNSSCENISISSDVSNYDDVDITSIDIGVKINCCDTSINYQITDFDTPDSLLVDNMTSGVREIILTPEFFNTTEALNDGVYGITIKVTKDDDSFVEETGCILVDCYIKCAIIDLIEKGDYEAHRIYEGIISANNCITADCNCNTACNLFKMLVERLELDTLDGKNINDCGCG